MTRGDRKFQVHWQRRNLTLDDGDTLHWLVMDLPSPPRVECFRLESGRGLHHDRGVAFLRQYGHPDAELRTRRD